MTENDLTSSGYTLVICEKPDAARRVAEAVAEKPPERTIEDGIEVFRVTDSKGEFVVCSAIGHLYAISDPFKSRGVYPVFDLEWFPANMIDEERRSFGRRIAVIRKLASGAKQFVNACDFDVEGETIGHNILRYACDLRDEMSLRAKFSTLTKDDLALALRDAKSSLGGGLASAGRARHSVDFLWGVNLSRALSEAVVQSGYRYQTISMGRVQGPTLSFVAEREIEIRTFVPTPYWTIRGVFEKDGRKFEAPYSMSRVLRRADAERVREACLGKSASVSSISTNVYRQPPPVPFNTGDLQKEAYRIFGLSPSRTLQAAERLYLSALISYPRTSSQKIPPSVDYSRIISNLGAIPEYSAYAKELLKSARRPHEGDKTDSAHPSIYPTGERPKRTLATGERRLFDLIVRRFLAVFADDAVRERVSAEIDVEGHLFKLTGQRTLQEGWAQYYGDYAATSDKSIPHLSEGDDLRILEISHTEKFRSGPSRYNQSTLLEKMETEEIGTKATRAEIISTLVRRGYVVGNSLTATDLGLSVIEMMREYSPQIVSTTLTRQVEKRLEEIETGKYAGGELIEEMVSVLSSHIALIKSKQEEVGREVSQSISATAFEQNLLGPCPVCNTGKLRMIRSARTHKRFVGCTNYPERCRASAPLPQRGIIRTTSKRCNHCGWPIVYVRLRRTPWRLCVNIQCPGKGEKGRNEVSTLQKRS